MAIVKRVVITDRARKDLRKVPLQVLATETGKLVMAKEQKSDAIKYVEKLRGGPLTFAGAIAAIRVTEEISLTQFAKRIGVSVQHLSDVEKGRRRVSVERAAKWAKWLGYPPIVFVQLVLQDEVNAAGLKLRVEVAAA